VFCISHRRAIVALALQAGIDPLSAMSWIRPDTTAGQILALQLYAKERHVR